jgi:hypothetical protein
MVGQPSRGRGGIGLPVRPPPSTALGGEASRKRSLTNQSEDQPGPSSFARNTRPRSADTSDAGGPSGAGGRGGNSAHHGQSHDGVGGDNPNGSGHPGSGRGRGRAAQRGDGPGSSRGGGAQARGRGQGAARGGRGRGIPPPFRPPAGVPSGLGSGLLPGSQGVSQPPRNSHQPGAVGIPTRPLAPQASARPPAPALPPSAAPKAKPTRKADSETPPAFPDPALVNNLVVAYEDSLRRAPPAPTSNPNPPKKRPPQVTYEYDVADPAAPTLLRCTIRLPPESNASQRVFVSAPAEKTAARKLAAADVMHELWRAGDVDDLYQAASHGSVPPPPKAVAEGTAVFPAKTPEFYDACETILAKAPVEDNRLWHPTLVTLPPLLADPVNRNAPPPLPLRPLLMLTALPLPEFSALTPLKLYQPYSTTPSAVTLTALPPIALSAAEHAMADHYTRRLFRAILNRPLLLEEGHLLVHLFLPPTGTLDGVKWEEVLEAQGEAYEPWQWRDIDALKAQAKDAMTTGKNEFGRRFEVKAVRPDLSPLSSPDDSPVSCSSCYAPLIARLTVFARPAPHLQREKGFPSIVAYIRSTSPRDLYLSSETQPLLELEKLPVVRSHLRSILAPVPEELPVGAPTRKVVHEQKCT